MNAKMIFVAAAVACVAPWALHAQPQKGSLLWTYTANRAVTSSAAVARDGTIYLGTSDALYAITNGGSNKWTFPVGVVRSPAVAGDGTIYFGDRNAAVHAVSATGSERWTYPLRTGSQSAVEYCSTPAVGPDGSVCFVASGRLYCLASTGARKWDVAIDDTSITSPRSPVIGPDGVIYVGSTHLPFLHALKPDGTEKWQLSMPFGMSESVALGPDGTIYASAFGLCAISAEGSLLWANPMRLGGSPIVGQNGCIYAADLDSICLWSFNGSGTTNWSAVPVPIFHLSEATVPAIDAAGTIYYCNSNSIWALDMGGAVQWVFASGYGSGGSTPTPISPTIAYDGTVYASFGNTLYAVWGGSPAKDAAWPMYGQNPLHTGKVERPVVRQPQKRSDSGFQFELFPHELGRSYQVDYSTNLHTWTSLTSFVANTLPTPVVDSGASNAPSRFYRAFAP